jgi:hypothetical protein
MATRTRKVVAPKETTAYACFAKDTGDILEFANGYGIFPKRGDAVECAAVDYRGAYRVHKVRITPL